MRLDLSKLAKELENEGDCAVNQVGSMLMLYSGCNEDESGDLVCGDEWLIVEDDGTVWTGNEWPEEPLRVFPFLAIIVKHREMTS